MSPKKRPLAGHGTGGWKQSVKLRKVEGGTVVGPTTEAASMDTPSDSVLGAFLLHAIFWGMMSVTISQKVAALAIADGARGKSLERLAQCGGGGARAVDTWRDLRKRLKTFFVETACVIIKVPLAMKAAAEDSDVTMLMPHKLLSVMYHRRGAEFLERLCGGMPVTLPHFWDNLHGHPSYPYAPDAQSRILQSSDAWYPNPPAR